MASENESGSESSIIDVNDHSEIGGLNAILENISQSDCSYGFKVQAALPSKCRFIQKKSKWGVYRKHFKHKKRNKIKPIKNIHFFKRKRRRTNKKTGIKKLMKFV